MKGQGHSKLTAEFSHISNSNSVNLLLNFLTSQIVILKINIDEALLKREIYLYPPPQDSWYSDLRTFLET